MLFWQKNNFVIQYQYIQVVGNNFYLKVKPSQFHPEHNEETPEFGSNQVN